MPVDVKYLKSAVLPQDYPDIKRPEIAIAGRSNAGKSSFINSLTSSKIARVSQEPGKTRLLNFFDVGRYYRFVDMPGYGFASRSGSEVIEWQSMIETYLSTRGNLLGLLLLMDIRRDWSEDEQMLVDFMNSIGKPTLLILTKKDKCSKKELNERVQKLSRSSHLSKVWPVSAQTNEGIKDVEDFFFNEWVKNKGKGN